MMHNMSKISDNIYYQYYNNFVIIIVFMVELCILIVLTKVEENEMEVLI